MIARAPQIHRARNAGFTLLEVVIAIAILATSLTTLTVAITRSIRVENQAKLMSAATFLARSKLIDIEDDLYDKGFSEFEKELTGTFEDKGFKRFSWHAVIDKVELPSSDQVQTAISKAQEAKQQIGGGTGSGSGSGSSDQTGQGPGAGMLASQFQTIKDVMEQGIRRITLSVSWYEGTKVQSVTVTYYITDPRKVDQSIQINAMPAGGLGSGSGSSSSSSSSTTKSTTTVGH